MNYILGGTYKSLLFALYLKNVLGEKTTIVTYKTHMIEFCKNQKMDYIKLDKIEINFLSIHKFFILKKMLDNSIKKINPKKGDNFFLLGNTKAHKFLYISQELSKKGFKVWYKMIDWDGNEFERFKLPWYKPVFIRGTIIRLMFKIFLDLDLVYYFANNHPFLGIDDNYFKKYNIEQYKPNQSSEDLLFESIEAYKKEKDPFECLIIGDADLNNIINLNSLEKLFKNILELSIDFAYKKHPAPLGRSEIDKKYYNIFKDCKELPEYEPVELFFSNDNGSVLSVYSGALITASKFSNLNTISLLELVKWKSEKNKNEVKKILMDASNNKILFPKNYEELKDLLLNVD